MKRILAAVLGGILLLSPCLTCFALSPQPDVKSETAVLMDAKTGQILYDKNMNVQMYPASTTKIMTGLLAVEKGNLTDVITMDKESIFSIGRGTSHIALDVGEQITLEQALYAVSIESANDAANGVAVLLGGSMDKFAQMMNDRAKELGAKNTHFVNAHGLHNKDHYTTAYDLALIAKEAIKYDNFNKIFSTEK
ncbi:MAG: serine hydrolase, partial [Oscillospiraceae bacterium]